MAVKLLSECDSCGYSMTDGDESYCSDCYEELKDKVKELEDEIEKLEEKINSLEE
jgi:hypothetical protein